MSQDDQYRRARGRAEAKYGFYVHLVVFIAVMGALIVIDLITSPGETWFVWPLAGWGLAVVLHGAGVFLFGERNSIVDSMTARELERLSSKSGDGPV